MSQTRSLDYVLRMAAPAWADHYRSREINLVHLAIAVVDVGNPTAESMKWDSLAYFQASRTADPMLLMTILRKTQTVQAPNQALFSDFTSAARRVIARADAIAHLDGANRTGTSHLLAALLHSETSALEDGVVSTIFRDCCVMQHMVRMYMEGHKQAES